MSDEGILGFLRLNFSSLLLHRFLFRVDTLQAVQVVSSTLDKRSFARTKGLDKAVDRMAILSDFSRKVLFCYLLYNQEIISKDLVHFWDVYVEFDEDIHAPTSYRARLAFFPADPGDGEQPARTAAIVIEPSYEEAMAKARGFEERSLQALLRSALP